MTERSGLIKTVAKGARRARSPLAGRLDLFVRADFQWSRSRKSELHTLGEVTVTNYRRGLRERYRDTVVAGYFGQLLELVLEMDHEEAGLDNLLDRALGYLEEKGADRWAFDFFELEVARLLGFGRAGPIGIREVYGKLPKSRDHCLDLLEKT